MIATAYRREPDSNPQMRPQAPAWSVLLALALPAAARAQDDADSAPTRRAYIDAPLEVPHDPFDLGARNTGYAVGLRIAEVYDDNLFLAEDAEEDDLITVLLLTADVRYLREEDEVALSYRGRERIYAEHDELNGMEHFIDAMGRKALGRARLEAGLEWRDLKDTFDALEVRSPVDSRFFHGYVRPGIDFNAFSVSLTGEFARFTIDDDVLDRGDYSRVGASLVAAARAWGESEAFGELMFRSTDYDEPDFSDFDYLRFAVGARGAFSPVLRGEARVGAGRTEAEDDAVDDFSGVILGGVVAWTPGEKHEIALGAFHEPTESVVTGLGVAAGVDVRWRFRLDERWTIRSSVRWGREADPNGDFDRTGTAGRFGVRWDSGGRAYADAGVLVRAAESSDLALEYDNVRFSLGLGVEW